MGPDPLLLKKQDPHLMELSPEPASTVKDMKARKMVILCKMCKTNLNLNNKLKITKRK